MLCQDVNDFSRRLFTPPLKDGTNINTMLASDELVERRRVEGFFAWQGPMQLEVQENYHNQGDFLLNYARSVQ